MRLGQRVEGKWRVGAQHRGHHEDVLLQVRGGERTPLSKAVASLIDIHKHHSGQAGGPGGDQGGGLR